MEKFTASNGMHVVRNGRTYGMDDELEVAKRRAFEQGGYWFGGDEEQALREFFRAEEDERLGRWRWPENPDYVAYPSDQFKAGDESGWVIFLHEPSGLSSDASRHARGTLRADMKFALAARAFFEAHPVRKPWEDAKPGEVWRWETEDKSQQALGWVAGDGSWDLIDPRGGSLRAVSRPVSALIEAGFDRFRGEPTANRYVPEEKD